MVTPHQHSHRLPEGWEHRAGPTAGCGSEGSCARPGDGLCGRPCALCRGGSRRSWEESPWRGTDKPTAAAGTRSAARQGERGPGTAAQTYPDSLAACQARQAPTERAHGDAGANKRRP